MQETCEKTFPTESPCTLKSHVIKQNVRCNCSIKIYETRSGNVIKLTRYKLTRYKAHSL